MRKITVPTHSPNVELFNPQGRAPILIVCDHAGKHVPGGLKFLGISEEALTRHIGWDIGAADVTRRLAERLDAPAILNHISRLVIDCNRRPGTSTSIPEVSDGCVIPGNQGLDMEAVVDRVVRYFLPYHRMIARRISRFRRSGIVPALISVHSFTPRLNGESRPWQIGILWRGDERLSRPLLDFLQACDGLTVGENQPYSGLRDFGFTVQFHGQRPRLPHVMVEIRQDEIDTTEKAHGYADLVFAGLRRPLADPELYQVYEGDNLDQAGGLISWRHASQSSPLA